MTPEELELAKAALRRLENQRLIEAVGPALKRFAKPEPPAPPPVISSDGGNRKQVRIVRRGCSGFFNRSFLNY